MVSVQGLRLRAVLEENSSGNKQATPKESIAQFVATEKGSPFSGKTGQQTSLVTRRKIAVTMTCQEISLRRSSNATHKSPDQIPRAVYEPWVVANRRLGRPTPTFTYTDYFTAKCCTLYGIIDGTCEILTTVVSAASIDAICQVENCLLSLQQGKIVPLVVLKSTTAKVYLYGSGKTTTKLTADGLLSDLAVSDTIVGIKSSGPHLLAKGKNGFYAWRHKGDGDFGQRVEVPSNAGEAFAIIKDAKGAAVVGFDSFNLASPNYHGELRKVAMAEDKHLAIIAEKEEKTGDFLPKNRIEADVHGALGRVFILAQKELADGSRVGMIFGQDDSGKLNKALFSQFPGNTEGVIVGLAGNETSLFALSSTGRVRFLAKADFAKIRGATIKWQDSLCLQSAIHAFGGGCFGVGDGKVSFVSPPKDADSDVTILHANFEGFADITSALKDGSGPYAAFVGPVASEAADEEQDSTGAPNGSDEDDEEQEVSDNDDDDEEQEHMSRRDTKPRGRKALFQEQDDLDKDDEEQEHMSRRDTKPRGRKTKAEKLAEVKAEWENKRTAK